MTGVTLVETEQQANNETAWRAVKNFRRMIPQLEAFARNATGKPHIRVTPGTISHTDGETLFLVPPFELGYELPHEGPGRCDLQDYSGQQICKACSVRDLILRHLFHEISHVVYETFGPKVEDHPRGREILAEYGFAPYSHLSGEKLFTFVAKVNPSFKTLLNALEDARIDERMAEVRPGLRRMGRNTDLSVLESGVQTGTGEVVHWRDMPVGPQAAVSVFYFARYGDEVLGKDYFTPEVEKLFADARLCEILNKVRSAKDLCEVFDLAQVVLALLKEHGFFLTKEEHEAQQESEPEQESQPDDAQEELKQEEAGESESQEDDQESGDSSASEDSSADDSDPGDEADSSPGEGGESGGSDGESESDESDHGSDSGADDSESESETDSQELASGESEDSGDPESGMGTPESRSGADPEDSLPEDDRACAGDSGEDSGEPESGIPSDDEYSPERAKGDDDSEQDNRSESQGSEGSESVHEEGLPESDGVEPDSDSGDQSGDDIDSGSDSDSCSSQTGDDSSHGQEPGVEPATDAAPDDSRGDSCPPSGDPADDGQEGSGDIAPDQTSTQDGELPAELGSPDLPTTPKTYEEYTREMGDEELVRRMMNQVLGHDPDELGDESLNEERVLIQDAVQQERSFDEHSNVVVHVTEARSMLEACQQLKIHKSRMRHGMQVHLPKALASNATTRLRKAFQENKRSRNVNNLRGGKVNPTVLGKRAPLGDDRLFRNKITPDERSYSAVISVDISSSTGSFITVDGQDLDVLALELMAVEAQADMLAKVGIEFAIIAHSAEDYRRANPEDKRFENGSDFGPEEVSPINKFLTLITVTVKDFTEPWGPDQRARLWELQPIGVNLDGHALEYMRHKVQSRKRSTDHVILYHSDGSMPYFNYEEELSILQRELKLCKRLGITVPAVGILNSDPIQHGMDMVQLDEASDITKVVSHIARVVGAG